MERSTILLILLLAAGATIASIDTQDVDELCSTDGNILKRQSGNWTCSMDQGERNITWTTQNVGIFPEKTGWISVMDANNGSLAYIHAKGTYVSTFYEMSPNAQFLPAYWPWTDKYMQFNMNNDSWVFRVNKTNTISFYGKSTDFHLKEPNGNVIRIYASDGSLIGRWAETSSGHSYFEIYDGTTSQSVRLRADGGDNFIYDGELGLGTTTPDSRLDVIGEVQISDLNTGSNAGTDLCADANGRLCLCGSCA